MNKPLPRSLQRQLAEAEDLQAQIARKPDTLQVSDEEPEAIVEVEPAQAQTTPVEPAPKPVEDAAKWEQRYRSLQGEFNKLVPDLQQQVARLKVDLEEATRKANKAERAPAKKLITEKDVDEFGADMLDVMERKARELMQEREEELLSRMEALESELNVARRQLGDVATTAKASVEEKFYTRLDSAVPGWRDINQSASWLSWLDGVDEFTGMRRQEVLNTHHSNLDVERVAAVFRAFKSTLSSAPVADSDDTLQGQVAPSRTVASPAPSTQRPQGRVFTGAEIQRFFDPRSRKLYTNEQYQSLEAEINRAISEGRVVP